MLLFCPRYSNSGDFSFPGFTNVYGFTYKTLSEGMKRLILKSYEVNTKCTNAFKLHLHIKLHIFHIKQYSITIVMARSLLGVGLQQATGVLI